MSKNFLSTDKKQKIIGEVKAHRVIWDQSDSSYKNLVKKENAFVEIATNLGLEVDVVKQAWNSLRRTYTNTLSRLKKGKITGTEGGENVEPTWQFFKSLTFLDPILKHRKTMTNIQGLEEEAPSTIASSQPPSGEEEEEDLEYLASPASPCSQWTPRPTPSSGRSSSTPMGPPAKKKARKQSSAVDEALMRVAEKLAETSPPSPPPNEIDTFALNMGCRLKKLDERSQKSAMRNLNEVMYQYEFLD